MLIHLSTSLGTASLVICEGSPLPILLRRLFELFCDRRIHLCGDERQAWAAIFITVSLGHYRGYALLLFAEVITKQFVARDVTGIYPRQRVVHQEMDVELRHPGRLGKGTVVLP